MQCDLSIKTRRFRTHGLKFSLLVILDVQNGIRPNLLLRKIGDCVLLKSYCHRCNGKEM